MNFYQETKQRLMEKMQNKGIKALILSPSINMAYTTGFNTFPGERLLISILSAGGELIFIAPKLYEQEIREKAYFDTILSWDDSQNPSDIVRAAAERLNLAGSTLAIEDTMWFSAFDRILKNVKNASFVPASELVGELRLIKSADETEKMRNSSHLADQALSQTIGSIKAGMTEVELRDILEGEMKKLGFDSPSFDTIIGSGPNSALPHYGAGERVLKDGDSLVVDFGGILKGYCSDMTRTFFIGQPHEEFAKVYAILKEAQAAAIAAVKPGVKAKDIDAAARSYIAAKGYGEYFIHRTGHGAGLEVHEAPYISDSSEVILAPGMIFSIEPGIYLPENFGIRIEDLVLVTETGAEVLNTFTKELIQL